MPSAPQLMGLYTAEENGEIFFPKWLLCKGKVIPLQARCGPEGG